MGFFLNSQFEESKKFVPIFGKIIFFQNESSIRNSSSIVNILNS